jgi:hypothetical protein
MSKERGQSIEVIGYLEDGGVQQQLPQLIIIIIIIIPTLPYNSSSSCLCHLRQELPLEHEDPKLIPRRTCCQGHITKLLLVLLMDLCMLLPCVKVEDAVGLPL